MRQVAAVVMLACACWSVSADAQTTFETDGDVEAQGFIGDGSQLTNVDAQLLDGMNSTAFAQDSDLTSAEAMLMALQAQVDALGLALVPRTGQATCYNVAGAVVTCGPDITGIAQAQDGQLELGVTWPNPRFTDNGNGTVTDNLTGLTWLDDANCFGNQTWANALAKANALFDGCSDCGGTNNDCGLSDSSLVGQWRLPNVRELQSLVHFGVFSPAVPNTAGTGKWVEGDPFSGVQSSPYWSSSSYVPNATGAWNMNVFNGDISLGNKTLGGYVWPVRGGQ